MKPSLNTYHLYRAWIASITIGALLAILWSSLTIIAFHQSDLFSRLLLTLIGGVLGNLARSYSYTRLLPTTDDQRRYLGKWIYIDMVGWLAFGPEITLAVVLCLLFFFQRCLAGPGLILWPLMGSVIGLLVGTLQWIWLRRSFANAGRWVLGSWFGYAGMALTIYLLSRLLSFLGPLGMIIPIDILAAWVLYGSVTGLAWISLEPRASTPGADPGTSL